MKHVALYLGLACTLMVGLLEPRHAAAQDPPPLSIESFWLDWFSPPFEEPFASLERDLLAKAQPDECFIGIGVPNLDEPPCVDGIPKVNEGYVYGLGKSGDHLWIGTVANMPCLVLGEIAEELVLSPPPIQTNSYVCEFGASAFLDTPLAMSIGLPDSLGDWRPPHIYRYDTASDTLEELIPDNPLLLETHGVRSVGVLGDLVIMAGQSIYASMAGLGTGVNFFAFHRDGTFLGATTDPAYNDIRRWVVVEGVLYAGVRAADNTGRVLRWNGTVADPFDYEEVGVLDSGAAEVALHEGRIFAGTWPEPGTPGGMRLYMSPVVPPEGLDPGHATQWEKVWQASDYEPDPIVASTYQAGAMASFDGWLNWGTIHLPGLGAILHLLTYGLPTDGADLLATLVATHRPTHLFRGQDFGSANESIQVLYGLPVLPAYVGGEWRVLPNGMGETPQFGLPGYGNFFNTYTWSMAVYAKQLFIGTHDWSYTAKDSLSGILQLLNLDLPRDPLMPLPTNGADLFRMPSAQEFALPETLSGLGNYLNYGLRNLIGDDALYVGTANPHNLRTDLTDDVPEGGWELLALRGNPPRTTHFKHNDRHAVSGDVFVPCVNSGLGEVVAVDGRLHTMVNVVVGPGGVHAKLHINPQRMRGVGLSTGDEYVVNGALNLTASGKTLPWGFHFVANFNAVQKGPGQNLRIHVNVKVAMDSWGGIQAGPVDLDVSCL